ncbi:ileal sodium/bile acid cotransporter-like [Dermatophagoides pteronyssinus]|uniref:ileal sodium/bile acid cotransporter-like n=1 Tax=Dermatophagoides pteronyssinus TaxID=6956 RepID=UPI003F67BE37
MTKSIQKSIIIIMMMMMIEILAATNINTTIINTATTATIITTDIDPDIKQLMRIRTIESDDNTDDADENIQSLPSSSLSTIKSTTTTSTTTTTTTMKPKPSRASPFLTNLTRLNNRNQSTSTSTTSSKWANQSLESALNKDRNQSITSTTTTVPRKSKFKSTNNKRIDRNQSQQQQQESTEIVSKEKVYKTPPMLKQIHDYLIVVLLISVMFAMGCSITWEQVWGHVRKPIGVIIGMISQFVLLPACAYFLIVIFQIDPLHATGLLILACSPGGVTSNVFAYFCEGDLSLSVTMTSFSTVVALIMMPFNVWLYGRNLETETLVIPYGKMTISLLTLTTPVAIGMLVNWKLSKIAPILTRIGSIAGFGIIIVCQTLEVFIFPDIFNDVPAVLYAAEFLLPILGLTLGFFAASLFRLSFAVRRTIAIEAGIQNVGTALTIITLSFPFEQLRKVWLFPFLYAFSMLAICCIVAVLYQLQKRFTNKTKSLDIMDHPKIRKLQQQQLKLQKQQQQIQQQYQQQIQQQQLGYPTKTIDKNIPGSSTSSYGMTKV